MIEIDILKAGKLLFKITRIILLWIPFSLSSPILADDQLSGILDGVLERYSNLPGLEVRYKREIITKSMALLGDQMGTDLAYGRIYFKPTNFLKVEQDTPRPETVTTDGDTLWWYIPQENLVYQYPSQKLGKELMLLNDIFHGLKDVGESFNVVQSDIDDEQEYNLQLIPNPPWQEIEHIKLSVARDNFNIRMVEIHNYFGSITRFILEDFSIKENLEELFFRFVAPEGVRVVKEDI